MEAVTLIVAVAGLVVAVCALVSAAKTARARR